MIDVCLLLEGTYPYVAGGVSTWVHQLISAMKEIRFGIIYIAPNADPTRKLKYEIPEHVLYLKEVYLHEYDLRTLRTRRPQKEDYQLIGDFYQDIGNARFDRFEEFLNLFQGKDKAIDAEVFFSSKEIWNRLTDFYDQYADNVSFLDFFWTWRGTHLPLMQILQTKIPEAKVYHSVSTGYAGLLGAMAKVLYGARFFLTEHGIYTHERMLEISQANWIYEREQRHYRADKELTFFKKWWIAIFEAMSRLSYHHADKIFTLFEGNKIRQSLEGADPDKITIIPNGIDLRGFEAVKIQKTKNPQIGLIGRVVPIKDIKTFITAAQMVLAKYPEATFYIIGPTDEEEDYYEECVRLVESLGLQQQVKFTGRVDIKEYYQFLDLVVLTSLSEAQPYVILEANCVGVPVVATDVGACSDMIAGQNKDDKNLGVSGLITQVSNPHQTADAILKLIEDKEFYQSCSEAGKRRVRKYYDQDDLLSRYLNVYEQNI